MTTQETTKFNKSKFIRERPDMKVPEIVAEAAKQGQTISPGTVWTLRSSDKRKASKASKKVAKKGPKASKGDGGKKFNKSSFIRKYSKLSAPEIIAKAKDLGQDITKGMVYTLRSSDRKKEEPVRVARTPKGTKKVASRPAKAEKTTALPTSHHSISFDPSDPVARKFITAGLAAIT